MESKAISLAFAVAASIVATAACTPEPYYGNNINSGYNPDPGSDRRSIPGGNGGYASKWDYYRNYNGAFHQGPEPIP